MIYIKDLIRKKRENKELTKDEIRFFVFKYFKDEIMEEQAAVLMSLLYTKEITDREMIWLTEAMAETGVELELYKISNKITDIHCIGGIEDKIVILLQLIIASLNIPIAKVSGRELGLLDRVKGIPNYKTDIDFEEAKKEVKELGLSIMAEPLELAPIENKMYNLRNKIACDGDLKLIAMSIMSQKIAIGVRNIIIDITFGNYTYVKTYKDAKLLAKYLMQIGKKVNKNIICLISEFEEPIGKYFGNLEIYEIINSLKGNIEKDVNEMVLEIGSRIIKLAGEGDNINTNKKRIESAIESGMALKKLKELFSYKNVNINIINDLPKASNIIPVISNKEGYIREININEIKKIAIYLDSIRKSENQKLDIGAGIELNKKKGDYIKKGEILGYIHTNNEIKIQKSIRNLQEAFVLQEKKYIYNSRILNIIEK